MARLIRAEAADLERLRRWRDAYRREMNCQIIHDAIHERPGWSREYLLSASGEPVGYGSLAIGGPWRDAPAAYELYVVPAARIYLLDLAEALLRTSEAGAIEVQSNDRLGLLLLHAFAGGIQSESILFEDGAATRHSVSGVTWRQPTPDEAPDTTDEERRWRAVIEVDGELAAAGGVLFHYNAPYGDIYMEVAEAYRRRGLGTLMVQELKRLCRERGFTPAARCNPANEASRRTLQKAGFVPCGHLLRGSVPR